MSDMKQHEQTVTVRLPETLTELVRERAVRDGVSMSEVVRRAVTAWVVTQAVLDRPPVTKREKGTPVVPAYDRDRDQAPPVESGTCRRCGHARASHWVKGCLAGCACSEGRYRD